jgi:hypothetical protein
VGVVQRADALVPMLQQHVIEPLLNGEHIGSGQCCRADGPCVLSHCVARRATCIAGSDYVQAQRAM